MAGNSIKQRSETDKGSSNANRPTLGRWTIGVLGVGTLCLGFVAYGAAADLAQRDALETKASEHLARARVALDDGEFRVALVALQSAQQILPDAGVQSESMRAHVKILAERPDVLRAVDDAYLAYAIEVVGASSPESLVAAGQLELRRGNGAAAVATFERALRTDAQYAPAYLALGSAQRSAGELTDAQTTFEQAKAKFPDNPSVLNNLGVVYHELGRGEEAVATLSTANEAGETAATELNLADVLSTLGRLPEAKEHLKKAAVLDPRSGEVWKRLGATLHAEGNFDEAGEAYVKAVALDGRPGTALELAKVRHSQKRYAESADVLQRILAADAGNIDAAYLLAEVLHELGDHAGAAVTIRRYLALSVGRAGEEARRATMRSALAHAEHGHEHRHGSDRHAH